MKNRAPPIAIVFEDEESPQFEHTFNGNGDNDPVIFYLRRDGNYEDRSVVFFNIQQHNWRGPFLALIENYHQIWTIEYPQLFTSGLLRSSGSRNRNVQCFLE